MLTFWALTGINAVQQSALGQGNQEGNQDHGAAVEEIKDHHVTDFIRDKYKSTSNGDGVE